MAPGTEYAFTGKGRKGADFPLPVCRGGSHPTEAK